MEIENFLSGYVLKKLSEAYMAAWLAIASVAKIEKSGKLPCICTPCRGLSQMGIHRKRKKDVSRCKKQNAFAPTNTIAKQVCAWSIAACPDSAS